MSGNWEGDAESRDPRTQSPGPEGQSPGPFGQSPTFPDQPWSPGFSAPDASSAAAPVDWSLVAEAEAPKPSRSYRKRIVAVAVAMSVVAAFAVVATVNSKEGGVHAALASVFSSPTLKVVVSGHSTNPAEEASVSRYSVALTVTSENGRQPLSGSDGVDDYEVSVLRGGVDLGDVIVADHGVYARVNLQAIDPNSYENELQSVATNVPLGSARRLALAFLRDQWVGIDDSTIESFVKSMGVAAMQQPSTTVNSDNLRNAFTLSFAQSWDAWASIHQLSSSNGVTRYSVKLPVQHFVSTFFKDIRSAVLKALPSADMATARSVLNSGSSAINRIPAGLEIPMTLQVTNGSLTGVEITYKGDSVDLEISHPTVGVTTPPGALMITTSMIHSLLGDYGDCVPVAGVAGAAGGSSSCGSSGIPASSGIASIPTISVGSGSAGGSSAGATAGSSASSAASASGSSAGATAGSSASSAASASSIAGGTPSSS